MNIKQAQSSGRAFAAELNKMAQNLRAVDNNSLFDQDPRDNFVSSLSPDGFHNTAEFKPTGEVVSLHRELSDELDRRRYDISVGPESTKYFYESMGPSDSGMHLKVHVKSTEISNTGEVLDYHSVDNYYSW